MVETHPVVDIAQNLGTEETSSIRVTDWNGLGQVQRREHISCVLNITNEHCSTCLANGAIGVSCAIRGEVAM